MPGADPRTPQKRGNDTLEGTIQLVKELKHMETLLMAAQWSINGENNMEGFKSKSGAAIDTLRQAIRNATHVRSELAGTLADLKREITQLRGSRDNALQKLQSTTVQMKNLEQQLALFLNDEFGDDQPNEKNLKVEAGGPPAAGNPPPANPNNLAGNPPPVDPNNLAGNPPPANPNNLAGNPPGAIVDNIVIPQGANPKDAAENQDK